MRGTSPLEGHSKALRVLRIKGDLRLLPVLLRGQVPGAHPPAHYASGTARRSVSCTCSSLVPLRISLACWSDPATPRGPGWVNESLASVVRHGLSPPDTGTPKKLWQDNRLITSLHRSSPFASFRPASKALRLRKRKP